MPPRRSPARKSAEIFLSHSTHNGPFVVKLARRLRREGLRVWYSERHIVGARQWHDEIGAALERCNWFIVVLSPTSVRSRWVKHELLYALRVARYNNRIVPLILEPCKTAKLSWTLDNLHHVVFTEGFEEGYRQLRQALRVTK